MDAAGGPALWAISAGTAVTPVQLSLLIPVRRGLAVLATVLAWRRMQLDR